MAWTLCVRLLLSLLNSYPELLLSSVCFLLFFRHLNRRSGRRVPLNWPIIGMLPGVYANTHRIRDFGDDVLSDSGCTFVFRGPWLLNMDAVVTCDPANVNHIFNANFGNYPKGEDFNKAFDILGHGIFNSDGESWRSQRRRAQNLITNPGFRSFVARCSREKVEKGLLPLLGRIADQGTVVNLEDVFLRLTFDTTCTLVLGVDPCCLAADFPSVPIAKAVDDVEQAVFYRHLFPLVWWRLTRWLGVGEEKKLAVAWEVIDRFLADTIAKRRADMRIKGRTTDEPADLLTSYIDDPVEGGQDSDKFLRDTTLSLLIAGRDTTGAVLAWFFWLLSQNPDAESRILEELEQHSPESSDGPTVFDPAGLGKLVYLHAALCECMRLYPPVAIEHKGVSGPDVLPSGVEVSAGTHLLINLYSMGRMKEVWGKDCAEFRPERWISERGKVRHEPSYKFLAFNCGPRTCLGKDMAFTQMKAAAAAMVYNFRVEVVEGHVVEPKLSIILHMKNGLLVRVKKRGARGW